jgi:hypothetical protein
LQRWLWTTDLRLPVHERTLIDVGVAVTLVLLIALPVGAGYFLFGDERRWEQWRAKRRPMATVEPIECLGVDLRRLRTRLENTENSPALAGKGLKLRAIRAAYVDALASACQQLEVSPPPRGRRNDLVPQWEIYRVESALRQRGLDVRERAVS